ncbi:fasciclin domain-containing protein [Cellulophaga sp. F20128]|uniref:fasciclin domain-containing protein n=1 Tax=Cellulophaga sp. F20128 TaxID=2926413 RepID=UPI001FF61D40|nr:fasciclin domain-containing protein [Cellulophaga sp. F20128]MCK0158040.1 fasciclin domain-containing protein [Cellulophaga sp. F20128]
MKNTLLILITLVFLSSCDSDNTYLEDGGLSVAKVDMSTVDFFRSHDQLDTLAILIENAGMEDLFNGSNTVFAPNNLSIRNYILSNLAELRETDPLAEFGLNDIPMDTLTKYMGGYVFDGKIKRENMTQEGQIYTAKNGEDRRLSLEPVAAYTSQLEEYPEYVYFTYKVGTDWDAWDSNIQDEDEKDRKFQIRTSNIESNNGIIHVLQGSGHTLFGYTRD